MEGAAGYPAASSKPTDGIPMSGPAREGSSANDSDATVRSSSEDASQPTARYGLRPKKGPAVLHEAADPGPDGTKSLQSEAPENIQDGPESKVGEEMRSGKRRKRVGKAAEAGIQGDGLLRLAQIAHATPRLPGSAGEKASQPIEDGVAGAAALRTALPKRSPGMQVAPATEAPSPEEAAPKPPDAHDSGVVGSPSKLLSVAAVSTVHPDAKLSMAQTEALSMSGQHQPLGSVQLLCPYIQPGPRWQLDLRTGERLEEALHPFAGSMQAGPGSFPLAVGMQGLGTRPPIFTAPGQQAGQAAPLGVYGVVPPPNFAGSLPIPALGQQPSSHNLPPAGPYTALLGPQMQPLLPAGALQSGHPAFGGIGQGGQQIQHLTLVPPKKRQRSSHAAELADLPEIPLRRRGRPAGDGTAAAASPHELQERRMQANRAAASRSHFRRKREMEILEKECATLENRMLELRGNIASHLAQEEALRLQQASIREHLAVGCKASTEHAVTEEQRNAPNVDQVMQEG